MQHYEIKNYFGRSYASTCQHCGVTIYKRNRNGNGKHAWLAYSKAAYRHDAEFEVLCRGCYDKAVKEYGPVISREEMLKKIDMWVNAESGHEKSEKYEKHEKYEEQEKHNNPKDSRKSIDSNNPTPRTKMIEDAEYREAHKSFKPYPIYTRGNVNMLLRAYRTDRNAKKAKSLNVYKVLCFNGKPEIIQTIQNDKQPDETIDYFDTEWNLLDLKQNFPNSEKTLNKPEQLSRMLAFSEQLSVGHPVLRVDWYCTNKNELYFSEFTFFSDDGMASFEPEEWDGKLGVLITLSKL